MVQELSGPSVLVRFCEDSGTNCLAKPFGDIPGKARLISISPLHIRLVVPLFLVERISDGDRRYNWKA